MRKKGGEKRRGKEHTKRERAHGQQWARRNNNNDAPDASWEPLLLDRARAQTLCTVAVALSALASSICHCVLAMALNDAVAEANGCATSAASPRPSMLVVADAGSVALWPGRGSKLNGSSQGMDTPLVPLTAYASSAGDAVLKCSTRLCADDAP